LEVRNWPRSTQQKPSKTVTHEGLPCCAQALACCAQAWVGSSQCPVLRLCAVPIFQFRHFVRKISTVNPNSIPFSPTRSTQLILSYFYGKLYFHILKTAYPRITYFSKTLKITFTQNPNFLPNDFSIPINNQKQKIITP